MRGLALTRRGALAGLGVLVASPGFGADDMIAGPAPREITHDPDQPVLGNPDGDVTLVEFYDYQCPWCRKGHPELLQMVRDDGNLRLVMKDWPVLGPASDHAVMLALGAAGLGRYEAAHLALMSTSGRGLKEAQFDEALRAAGIDPEAALDAFQREGDRWGGLVTRNMAQADMLGLMGTPSYVVGLNVFPGVTPMATLRSAIGAVRRG